MSHKRIYGFLALLAVTAGISCAAVYRSYFAIRLDDFDRLRAALSAYHADNKAYPVGGGVSVIGPNGRPVRDWIAGLSPKYLDPIPRDPRYLKVSSKQYLYISDGKAYKLIAHDPEDIKYAQQVRPDLIDPRRPAYAYGIWSEGAAEW